MNSLFYLLKHQKTPKKRDVRHWKTAVNNGIRSVCHVLAVFFSVYFACISRASTVNTSKTNVFLVLTEPENYRITERILEFTGKKTTEKQWILRPENAREFKQNAAFSKINQGYSVTVNTRLVPSRYLRVLGVREGDWVWVRVWVNTIFLYRCTYVLSCEHVL